MLRTYNHTLRQLLRLDTSVADGSGHDLSFVSLLGDINWIFANEDCLHRSGTPGVNAPPGKGSTAVAHWPDDDP
jgi:hypothetical protein